MSAVLKQEQKFGNAALKVLIVDDDPPTRLMLGTLASQLGYRTVYAKNGETAISVFAAEQPDIVLMDMYLPGMQGDEAMTELRALSGERWVPIIFVTIAGEVGRHVATLVRGADDYLVKPVDQDVLGAKLEVARRTIALQRQVEEKTRELRRYRDDAENEMRMAKEVIDRLVHADRVADPMASHWILPAANFSGDLVAVARTPTGVLHVMLADGTGHGLSAALSVLPITPSFYAMTAKGLPIELIASTLNRTIREQLPVGRFVATTLVSVNSVQREVKVWNGGNPPLLALAADGTIQRKISSRHLALGIAPPESFDSEFDSFRFEAPCQLFLYSDGVPEGYEAAGETSGQAAVEALLLGVPANTRMKLLRSRLSARHLEQRPHDDVTVVLVDCSGGATVTATKADSRRPSAGTLT
jgi:CheY-like chemotaxis protein